MSSKRKETAQEEEPQENGTPANKRKKTKDEINRS